jgi:hypothetical protein
MTRTVEHIGESWFRDQGNPTQPDPDLLDAVRISSYASWILEKTAPETCNTTIPGDVYFDCRINLLDVAVLVEQWLEEDCGAGNDWCQEADVQPRDGNVNLLDFSQIAEHWLECQVIPIEACSY